MTSSVYYSLKENGGSPLAIFDNGISVTAGASSIDFTGAGVEVSAVGGAVTVNIPGGSGGTQVVGEILGTGNGVTTVFTFAHTPNPNFTAIYIGPRLIVSEDYTLATNQITFNFPPPDGAKIVADYSY